ncbi:MAG: class I SAM-dependent methyltransferase, partial [Phycisphaerae bacterium]
NVEPILSGGPTGLPDNSVDAVLLYDVFHLLADPAAVLHEVHRVLRPQGFLSFSDHHMGREEILTSMTAAGLFSLATEGRYTFTFARAKP